MSTLKSKKKKTNNKTKQNKKQNKQTNKTKKQKQQQQQNLFVLAWTISTVYLTKLQGNIVQSSDTVMLF